MKLLKRILKYILRPLVVVKIITTKDEDDMDPATIGALLTVGMRVIDFLEKRGGEGGLDAELLAAREQLRAELMRQAEAEGS